jgi:hypothetical protein
MDPANISWLESDPDDNYWEAYHRRDDTEGDRDIDSPCIPPDFDDNEDVGFVVGRRERLAEAMYDC